MCISFQSYSSPGNYSFKLEIKTVDLLIILYWFENEKGKFVSILVQIYTMT